MYEVQRFIGSIQIKGVKLSLGFEVSIDENGELTTMLDPLPATREAMSLETLSSKPGRRLVPATLAGTAANGHSFYSERFLITGFGHSSGPDGSDIITYSGQCTIADIRIPRTGDTRELTLIWWFRRFETFRMITHESNLGPVFMGGARSDPEKPQLVTGRLGIHTDCRGPDWFKQAEDRLDHVARVMSFASGLYLKPYVIQKFTEDEVIVTVTRHGTSSPPELGIFHFIHYDDIFDAACDSTTEIQTKLKRLDPAVQWLLTPSPYTEIRLIGAMTAIECILDTTMIKAQKHFMSGSGFDKLASAVRKLLNDRSAPEGIAGKVPELNRRTFEEKLNAYLTDRQIALNDLPTDSVSRITNTRNNVVHRGVYDPDETKERGSLFDHALLAREITMRMLLDVVQFRGRFVSVYFDNKFLDFPTPVNPAVTEEE